MLADLFINVVAFDRVPADAAAPGGERRRQQRRRRGEGRRVRVGDIHASKEDRMENVIALAFSGAEQAREGVRALQRLHRSGDLRLEAVAIIERAEDGRVFALEEAEAVVPKGTVGGGLIGAVVGLLTGPVGLVVGAATGAVVGSLVDVAEGESSEDVVRWFGRAVPRGHTGAIGLVVEPTPAVVDALARDLGVAVLRRSRGQIEQEIAAAEAEAQADATTDDAGGTGELGS